MKTSSSSACCSVLVLVLAGVQANPLNFPGSGLLSVSSRVPNPCLTTEGTLCVFPFTYQSVEYYQCTYASSPTPWCATRVDTNGTVITNNWGDCSNSQLSSCPAESLTSPSCTSITGTACIFPFRHLGIVYNQCSDVAVSGVTGGEAWCSTNITTAGEHILGSEAVCPNTCPGAETTTTTTTTTTTASSTTASSTTASTSTTTTTTTTTTTSSTTTTASTVNTNALRSHCVTVSGPSEGQSCVFPFTFQGVTYNGCADWVYGGENSGKTWCSTNTDQSGQHEDGAGHWAICPQSCPQHNSLDFL